METHLRENITSLFSEDELNSSKYTNESHNIDNKFGPKHNRKREEEVTPVVKVREAAVPRLGGL